MAVVAAPADLLRSEEIDSRLANRIKPIFRTNREHDGRKLTAHHHRSRAPLETDGEPPMARPRGGTTALELACYVN